MHGRCLGPTRSLQGKVEGTAQRDVTGRSPGYRAAATGAPVRSLRHE
ncbi:hypothetical protein J4733_29260 [Klebsiella pneumoniae]|uniref:Uncharacterized protein n=1 Tax=Klebsiella pneumoniae TaxID=573 RepID=A0A939NPC1_KLEPN|nr:hypothetical protein [Klebsiella pneumoniae]